MPEKVCVRCSAAGGAPTCNYGWLLAPALLVYPFLYYIASVDSRYRHYRHSIEPVMLILAVCAVASAMKHGPYTVTARKRPAAL